MNGSEIEIKATDGAVSKVLPYLMAAFLILNILNLTGVLKRKK